MRRFFYIFYFFLISFAANGQVEYDLTYDSGTGVYTVSMESEVGYNAPFSRMSSSTQITVVFPHTMGGFQINNLTNLQGDTNPLSWTYSRIDAPTENPNADYLIFTVGNSGTYTPLDIPANTTLELFSFESNSGCIGDVALFDNDNDPLLANTNLNTGHNMVILGGGLRNLFDGVLSNTATCASTGVDYCLSLNPSTGVYTISMESKEIYNTPFSRMSSSTQITVVVPHTMGGFQISNLTNLQAGTTPLNWSYSRIDAPAENPNADYLIFSVGNSGTYTPFDIPANTFLDLFSFESNSGCLGEVALFNNDNDPLLANTNLNTGHNMVILGGGLRNLYAVNVCGPAICQIQAINENPIAIDD
ncbi:MAG: hypothetical protein AB8G86_05260, partial [Saprospiraceae bacterium]